MQFVLWYSLPYRDGADWRMEIKIACQHEVPNTLMIENSITLEISLVWSINLYY